MTTIIVDVKNAKVYSDTLTTSTNGCKVDGLSETWAAQNKGAFQKIFSFNDYVIVGTGCMNTLKVFSGMFPENALPRPSIDSTIAVLMKRHESICAIVYETVETKRTLFDKFKGNDVRYTWKHKKILLTDDWHTFGSGRHIAIGALKAGASPEEAIRIVSSVDYGTGDESVCFDIP